MSARIGLFVLAGLAFACLPMAGKDNDAIKNLTSRSRSLSITGQDAPPFHASLEVIVTRRDDTQFRGSYDLFWLAPDKSREEQVFPDFEQRTIAEGGRIWRQVPTHQVGYAYYLIQRLVHGFSGFSYEEFEKNGKISRKSPPDTTCIETKGEERPTRACFRSADAALVSYEDEVFTFAYADYRDWQGRRYPATARLTRLGRTVIESKVISLEPLLASQPVDMSPQPGWAEECTKPAFGRLTKHVAPRYPDGLRSRGVEGTVYLSIAVTPTGDVTNPVVLDAPDPDMNDAAIRAVTQWQFEPATCGGRAFGYRASVRVSFQLGGPAPH